LRADLFIPRKSSAPVPVAVFLNGIGADWIRTHAQYQGWGKLVTGAGLAGVAMDSAPDAIEASFDQLLKYLRVHAKDLRIDPERILLWSCSSNVRAGVPLAMDEKREYIKGAVIYYGSASPPRLRLNLPVLLVRAGLDSSEQNRSLDEMAASMMRWNVPLSVINVTGGRHGFDLVDDTPVTRRVIADTLAFMREALDPEVQKSIAASAPEAEAAACAARGQWQRAVQAYGKLIEANPKSYDLQRKLGDALSGAADYSQALSAYQRAIDLGDPNTGMVAYAAAVAALKSGDRDGALRWLERLAGIPPARNRAKSDPVFADLKNDPRFTDILGK